MTKPISLTPLQTKLTIALLQAEKDALWQAQSGLTDGPLVRAIRHYRADVTKALNKIDTKNRHW